METSYRRSPYFEYYEEELRPVYENFKPEFLVEWNIKLFEVVNKIIEANIKLSFTTEYHKQYDDINDYRELAAPQVLAAKPVKQIKYQQVFEERHGFIPDLSIIDLLFCEGPHLKSLLIS